MEYQISLLYFSLLFLYTLVELILLSLNLKSAKKITLDSSIQEISKIYDQKELEKSINYTSDKTILGIIQLIYSSLILFVFIKFGIFGLVDEILRAEINNFYFLACSYVFLVSFIFSILQLPFNLYSSFVIEERYGFNKLTLKLWFFDLIKSLLLSAIFLIPLLCALFYFMRNSGEYWWLYAFLIVAGFQILLLLIFPIFIAPLFNKFEPLKDQNLSEEIFALANKLEFESSGIYQMDGSKRSAHANAYFSGFGKSRRIVLFDTLIEKLSSPQILSVLAHEIGHAKKKHILKSMVYAMGLLLVAFYILSFLINYPDFFKAFGINKPSSYSLLILFNIAFEPIMFFISPLSSIFSRKNEYEADEYAVKAMGSSEPLEEALMKLSKSSLSNLNPHWLYSFFHYSHPTLFERIKMMRNVGV